MEARTRCIGIFGGTFNPPHTGHEAVLRIALGEFGDRLEKVLVVPANEPYYKETAVSAADRLEMCRRAFAGFGLVEVSDLDIRRGGTTYTVDTLADVKALYGKDVQPVFILGSDSFASLGWWKDADRLSEECIFLVVKRGSDEVPDAAGRRVWVCREAAPAVSSTEIRGVLGHGDTVDAGVPPQVMWYIQRRNLYGIEQMTDMDVFSDTFIEARKRELLPRVGERRYAHIMGVAETARELALVYGVDPAKAYLAGLLHDWDKHYDDDGIRARADELGLVIPDEVYRGAPQTLHGLTAAAWFSRAYPEIPADVLQAVSRHTTGAVDMSDLDMVVYIADALEPGRHFEGLDALRAQVGQDSLEELFISVQAYWISLIVTRKRTLHPDTFAVWNHYAIRHKLRKAQEDTSAPGDWSRKPAEALE